MKDTIRSIPVVGNLASITVKKIKSLTFPGSSQYWESRYATGGNSGIGSYGQLAQFKAEILNSLVQKEQIHSVLEFGCGDGAQLALANYSSYVGLDISKTAIKLCQQRYANDPTKTFILYDPANPQWNLQQYKADLAISLDVIYHLTEDATFERYMHDLFESAQRFVVIYSSNYEEIASTPHIRHRKFSNWIEAHQPTWELVEHIPNRYPLQSTNLHGSFADFYIYQVKN